jgi:hypothetical protein
MVGRATCLGTLVVLMPLSLEIPAGIGTDDGSATRVRVAGGGGAYAFIARGCEGQVIDRVPVRFEDAGGSLEHRFGAEGLAFGVRGGFIRHRMGAPEDPRRFAGVPLDTVLETRYVNPFLAVEGEEAGVGVGLVFHDGEFLTAGESARLQAGHPANDLSAHVRVGPHYGPHVLVQWMEGVPLASSGGYLTALAGGPLRDLNWILRAGLGAGGPYEGAGLVLRLEYADRGPLSLDFAARLGVFGDDGHWGAAAGIAYSWSLE